MTRTRSFLFRYAEPILAVLFTLCLAYRYGDDLLWLAHALPPARVKLLYVLLVLFLFLLECVLQVRARRTGQPYYLLTCIPIGAYLSGAAVTVLLPWFTLLYFAAVGGMRLWMYLQCRGPELAKQRRYYSALLVDLVLALCTIFTRFVTSASLYAYLFP